MALIFYCRRIGSSLVPVNEAAEEELRRLPELKVVRVQVVQERSAKQNAFFWALCDRVAKALNASGYDNVDRDWVADELKKETGHYDVVLLGRGECRELGIQYGATTRRPRSISFDAMDPEAFSAFLTRVVGFVLSELLPSLPTSDFTKQVERLLDDDARAAWVEYRRKRSAA